MAEAKSMDYRTVCQWSSTSGVSISVPLIPSLPSVSPSNLARYALMKAKAAELLVLMDE
jgi:hypothetical protein